MGTLANSEDPDEMGQQCLLKIKSIFRERKTSFLCQILTCDPSIYKMDHPGLTVSNFIVKSIGLKRVKEQKSIYRRILFI